MKMVNRILKWFDYDELEPEAADVADDCRQLAEERDSRLEEGPEKTTGLRKLLEARDSFLRATYIPGG